MKEYEKKLAEYNKLTDDLITWAQKEIISILEKTLNKRYNSPAGSIYFYEDENCWKFIDDRYDDYRPEKLDDCNDIDFLFDCLHDMDKSSFMDVMKSTKVDKNEKG